MRAEPLDGRTALAVAASGLGWLALGLAATTRARRVVLAVLVAVIVVVQASVFRHYHVPLDVQVAASAAHAHADVRRVLVRWLPWLGLAVLGVTAFELALLSLAHRVARARRGVVPALLALAVVFLVLGPPLRRATPEVRLGHAVAITARDATRSKESAGDRVASAVTLPPLHVDRPLPSVLLILTESVRAEDYVAAGATATAPETAKVTPGRVDLAEMRSVASYTAVSLSAILTARSQEGARDDILRAPNLFDFARAARDPKGKRPTVAYWSSQSHQVFESKDVRASLDRFTTIEHLLGRELVEEDPRYEEGLDALVVERFEADMASLPMPAVATLHLADTHAPYVVDPAHAPFQPVDHVVAWSRMDKLHNAYKDAIYLQDRLVARAIAAFRARVGDAPYLVLFTSDHGEAFGEHGAIHHGQNLFDEQVHVPGFVAWGNGALDATRAAALAKNHAAFATHLDVLPTLLDALGLWDNFAVAPHRQAMRGHSLLRERAPLTVPATNCTQMFPCPMNTWGLYRGDRKLLARIYDGDFGCWVVGGGGERSADPDDTVCRDLRAESKRTYPLLPNGAPNR